MALGNRSSKARHGMNQVMRFCGEVVADLLDCALYGSIDRLGDEPDTLDIADDSCRGYLVGIALRTAAGVCLFA